MPNHDCQALRPVLSPKNGLHFLFGLTRLPDQIVIITYFSILSISSYICRIFKTPLSYFWVSLLVFGIPGVYQVTEVGMTHVVTR